jgi:catechol 2,3-dioxygenase-like lactoylglutathione lyase family enzyme
VPALPVAAQITFVFCTDLERSHAFYSGALGLDLALDQGSCRIYRVAGAAFLGICARPEAVSPEGVILTLVVDDVAAWHEHLAAQGVPVEQAPADSEAYRIEHAFYRDPDGHLVEIQTFRDPRWAG